MAVSRNRRKKKKGKGKPGGGRQQVAQLSPMAYIKQRARGLEIKECIINKNWNQGGMASILVSRQHSNGNVTTGIFLIDMWHRGLKDSGYHFNQSPETYNDLLEAVNQAEGIGNIQCDYELAHQLVYGGAEFALEGGYRLPPEFAASIYIMEPQDAVTDGPEVTFGQAGLGRIPLSDISGIDFEEE